MTLPLAVSVAVVFVCLGIDAPRSRGHLVHVGLEVVKLPALIAGGGLLLSI